MEFVLKADSLKKFLHIGSFEELNRDFFKLYNMINNHDYSLYSSINYHDGLLDIDLKAIKGRLKNLFGTSNISLLKALRDDIIQRGTDAYVKNKGLFKYYQKYMKNITRDKKYFKRKFNKSLVTLIDTFIDLLSNNQKYSRLDVGENVVNLFIAHSIMLDCKKWQSWQDKDRLKYFFDLLTQFISEHYDLFISDFTYKDIHARDIAKYMGIDFSERVEEPKDSSIEKFDYTFFESKEVPSEKLFSSIIGLARHEKEKRDLVPFLERKIALYRSLGYERIMVGKESFNGYIGFVLGNGYIILDKLFESLESCNIAIDNAIYIIREEDFNVVTRYSKTEMVTLINEGTIDAKRVIHVGDYESRVKKILNLED